LLFPRSDPIDQSPIGIRHEVLAQPVQIDLSWTVSAPRLVLNVSSFPETSQQSTHRGLAYAEQRGRRRVRAAFLRAVRLNQSPPKIYRCLCHPDV
jgi:hypothetical protein